jgi:hypothetical protein
VNNVLSKVAKANGIEVAQNANNHCGKLLLKSIFNFSKCNIFALASAYFVYGFLMQVGVDQDYAQFSNSLFT